MTAPHPSPWPKAPPLRNYHPEDQYLNLLRRLIDVPVRPDRTGTGRKGIFGAQMIFDMDDGFPLLTTKFIPFKLVAQELLWFLSGSTNARDLEDQGCNIWKEWGDPDTREMGPIYGYQWRSWPQRPDRRHCPPIDQIAKVLQSLRDDPFGSRHIVSAWNPADIPDMALPPCHCLFQFHVETDNSLSLQLYQRSADIFLGVPFNIASYALLLRLFAATLGRRPGRLIWTGGDVHLYANHVDQARLQITREPMVFPQLDLTPSVDGSMDDWTLGDMLLRDYRPWFHIPAPVSA